MTARAAAPAEWLLGVPVRPLSMRGTLDLAEGLVRERRHGTLCFTNVHVVMESRRDPAVRAALRAATAVLPDGMPLVWFLRWRGHKGQERVYGPDFTAAMLARAAGRRLRVFLYGGRPDTLRELARRLPRRFRGLTMAGTLAPPYRVRPDRAAEREDVSRINRARPDIVFVGLGAPKQELWMRRNRAALRAPVLAGVGAAFDFLAGTKPQAPRWMMRFGLEWVFRLVTEPRRLWGRYLVHNPRFVLLAVLQELGLLGDNGRPWHGAR
jgi:N-acetylglucosaminyldiphosphoundecaprenol N-acetyl-beta-D-mannosaminyltransferase